MLSVQIQYNLLEVGQKNLYAVAHERVDGRGEAFHFYFLKNEWCSNRQEAVEDGSGKTCECEDQFEKNKEAWSW